MTMGNSRKCPLCGFQYEIGSPSASRYEPPAAMTFLGGLFRVVLIIAAIVAVLVGVLFIGCIALLK